MAQIPTEIKHDTMYHADVERCPNPKPQTIYSPSGDSAYQDWRCPGHTVPAGGSGTKPEGYGEPWGFWLSDRLDDGDADCIEIENASGSIAEMQCPADIEEAYARRIVFAVNACAGLSNAELEAMGVGAVKDAIEACKAALDVQENWYTTPDGGKVTAGNLLHNVVDRLPKQPTPPTGDSGTDADHYRDGFIDGLTAYAWWKDGVQYVGTSGRTLSDALAHLEEHHTWHPPKQPTPPAGASDTEPETIREHISHATLGGNPWYGIDESIAVLNLLTGELAGVREALTQIAERLDVMARGMDATNGRRQWAVLQDLPKAGSGPRAEGA